MPSIRTVPNTSGSTSVQVVRYRDRKVVVMKHIGSASTKKEIDALVQSAEIWMREHTGQLSFFEPAANRTVSLAYCSFVGVRHAIALDVLRKAAEECGFLDLYDAIAIDLALMRVFEPCSKRRSIVLLERYFGIHHAERTLYRALRTIDRHKDKAEACAVVCAKRTFAFDCSLVFYDVTTLYFESFYDDEEGQALRKKGFSKDQKSQQPQVVVGLLVTSQGFPLGYELFKGNTFEGHTMLPVLQKFKEAHGLKYCTVVADAGMLSFENIEELKKKDFSYIVGARIANLSPALLTQIIKTLERKEGATMRIAIRHGDLICSFSNARYRKDKHDMEKQVARAQSLIKSSEPGRRAKFVKTSGTRYTLNAALMEKTEKLLGIKGYVTNIPQTSMSNLEIIMHYRNLWRVEQTFRMAKSDLEVRPIFHQTDEAIRSHLLICFLAMTMSKYMELKTNMSLAKILDILRSMGEARILESGSGKELAIPAASSEEARNLLKKLCVSY